MEKEVKIEANLDAYRENFITMMIRNGIIKDDYLGLMTIVKQGIKFTSNRPGPVQWAAYGAGQRHLHLRIKELDEMVEMRVIDQAETKWGASVAFSPTKDEFLSLCGLKKVKLRHCMRFLPRSENGLGSRLIG